MTKRKYNRYIPVTIEALQPDGSWSVRNSFINENAEVRAGSLERNALISKARMVMVEWVINYSHYDSSLRISNGGR